MESRMAGYMQGKVPTMLTLCSQLVGLHWNHIIFLIPLIILYHFFRIYFTVLWHAICFQIFLHFLCLREVSYILSWSFPIFSSAVVILLLRLSAHYFYIIYNILYIYHLWSFIFSKILVLCCLPMPLFLWAIKHLQNSVTQVILWEYIDLVSIGWAFCAGIFSY